MFKYLHSPCYSLQSQKKTGNIILPFDYVYQLNSKLGAKKLQWARKEKNEISFDKTRHKREREEEARMRLQWMNVWLITALAKVEKENGMTLTVKNKASISARLKILFFIICFFCVRVEQGFFIAKDYWGQDSMSWETYWLYISFCSRPIKDFTPMPLRSVDPIGNIVQTVQKNPIFLVKISLSVRVNYDFKSSSRCGSLYNQKDLANQTHFLLNCFLEFESESCSFHYHICESNQFCLSI